MPWNTIIPNLIIFESTPGQFSGVFGYSPAPGPGNLIYSLAVTSGTDPFGNAYLGGGLVIYGTGGSKIFLGELAGTAELQMYTGEAIESTPANLFTGHVGSGVGEFLQTGFSGPKLNVANMQDWVQLQLNSSANGQGPNAVMNTIYVDNAQVAHTVTEIGPQNGPDNTLGLTVFGQKGINISGMFGGFTGRTHASALADVTPRTCTVTTTTQVSTGATIPGGDMVAGTIYKLHIYGIGTQGTTAQSLVFTFTLDVFNTALTVPVSVIPASAQFRWHATCTYVCLAPGNGSAPSIFIFGEVVIATTAFTQATSTAMEVAGGAAQNINTGNNNAMALFVHWSTVGTGQTITGQCSWPERIA